MLSFYGFTYQWNHIIGDLFCLTFTKPNVWGSSMLQYVCVLHSLMAEYFTGGERRLDWLQWLAPMQSLAGPGFHGGLTPRPGSLHTPNEPSGSGGGRTQKVQTKSSPISGGSPWGEGQGTGVAPDLQSWGQLWLPAGYTDEEAAQTGKAPAPDHTTTQPHNRGGVELNSKYLNYILSFSNPEEFILTGPEFF